MFIYLKHVTSVGGMTVGRRGKSGVSTYILGNRLVILVNQVYGMLAKRHTARNRRNL